MAETATAPPPAVKDEKEEKAPKTASVEIKSLSEHRTDGSYWVNGTVDGAEYNMRWARPLDPTTPGAQKLALAFADEYQAVKNILEGTFAGETIEIPFVGGPMPAMKSVVFSADPDELISGPGAGEICFKGTVDGSAEQYSCNVTTDEFLGWSSAGLDIGQIVATKIVQNYMASTGALAGYVGTFDVTPTVAGLSKQQIDEKKKQKKAEKEKAKASAEGKQPHDDKHQHDVEKAEKKKAEEEKEKASGQHSRR